uniref:Uncharacterized protein n=1 Tax=Knipowitschia caucasica TaxID=637954 RepID=A0AAV2KP93_KNICA
MFELCLRDSRRGSGWVSPLRGCASSGGSPTAGGGKCCSVPQRHKKRRWESKMAAPGSSRESRAETWIKEEPSEVREQLVEVSAVAVKSEEPPSSISVQMDWLSPDPRVKEEPPETWIKEEPSEVREQLVEVSAVAVKSEELPSSVTVQMNLRVKQEIPEMPLVKEEVSPNMNIVHVSSLCGRSCRISETEAQSSDTDDDDDWDPPAAEASITEKPRDGAEKRHHSTAHGASDSGWM